MSFVGKSQDYSVKALIRHWVLGYKLPFDRHDWTVQRYAVAHLLAHLLTPLLTTCYLRFS